MRDLYMCMFIITLFVLSWIVLRIFADDKHMNKGGHNDKPSCPRPNTKPPGQGLPPPPAPPRKRAPDQHIYIHTSTEKGEKK